MKNLGFALTALLCGCAAASAQTVMFNVSLTAVSGTGSGGTGSGTLTLNTTAHTLTLNNITFSGLGSNTTAAHIHGPLPGSGVLYDLSGVYTSGSTSGTFNGTINLVNGTGGYTVAQQETQLQANQWYINVHTSGFGGGEIAGTITAVPEPATVALWMGAAGVAFACLRRRERLAS